MNKRWATVTIIVLLLVFVGYIVVDITLKQEATQNASAVQENTVSEDNWIAGKIFDPSKGQLNAVAVSDNGNIILGGELFVTCYAPDFGTRWEFKPEMPVTALRASGDTVFAGLQNKILVLNSNGELKDEWGPYEQNAYITSIATNGSYVVFGDAANKKVFVLDRNGVVKSIIGKPDDPFILPSFYFEVAIDKMNIIFVANTGNRRIERRNVEGKLLSYFGQAGIDSNSFCGCCNPAHFILIPGGFVTAEKGINRIKILNEKGDFVEYVSSVNKFIPALPLDLASTDGKTIYAANPADSKLYVFTRK